MLRVLIYCSAKSFTSLQKSDSLPNVGRRLIPAHAVPIEKKAAALPPHCLQEYDVTLKLLLQGAARLTMRELTGTAIVKWLDVELPKVQNFAARPARRDDYRRFGSPGIAEQQRRGHAAAHG